MQRLRGSRLVHFFGVGQCVLPPDNVDTSARAGDTAGVTRLRTMQSDDVDNIWDFVVLEFMHVFSDY